MAGTNGGGDKWKVTCVCVCLIEENEMTTKYNCSNRCFVGLYFNLVFCRVGPYMYVYVYA